MGALQVCSLGKPLDYEVKREHLFGAMYIQPLIPKANLKLTQQSRLDHN